jgi:hypothetical protein
VAIREALADAFGLGSFAHQLGGIGGAVILAVGGFALAILFVQPVKAV